MITEDMLSEQFNLISKSTIEINLQNLQFKTSNYNYKFIFTCGIKQDNLFKLCFKETETIEHIFLIVFIQNTYDRI